MSPTTHLCSLGHPHRPEQVSIVDDRKVHFLHPKRATPNVLELLRDYLHCQLHPDLHLGEGADGAIYHLLQPGPHIFPSPRPEGNASMALKIYFLEHFKPKKDWFRDRQTRGWGKSAQRYNAFRGEVKSLKKLQHPNVVALLGSFEVYYKHDEDKPLVLMCGPLQTPPPPPLSAEGYQLAFGGILLEKCSGTVKTWLHDLGQSYLNKKQAVILFWQVAKALRHMHEVHITHNDIKADNVGIRLGPKQDQVTFRVLDFGSARQHKAPDWTAAQSNSSDHSNPFARECVRLAQMIADLLGKGQQAWDPNYRLDKLLEQILSNERAPSMTMPGALEIFNRHYPYHHIFF